MCRLPLEIRRLLRKQVIILTEGIILRLRIDLLIPYVYMGDIRFCLSTTLSTMGNHLFFIYDFAL